MAIAKEDISEGWYRVQIRSTGDLIDVEVWQTPDGKMWVEYVDVGDEIDAVLKQVDFIARVEPPEGL